VKFEELGFIERNGEICVEKSALQSALRKSRAPLPANGVIMEKFVEFQNVARKQGFIDEEKTKDGTVLWLKKATSDAEDRMCIDSLTNSVTVFWATIPWKINSRTFRSVAALEEWFMSSATRNGLIKSS